MNRRLTALFAALEALLVVGIGIGIPLVPLTVMWAAQYGLQVDWLVFWRAAVDTWLLGHGADLRFTLDEAVAASAGFAGAGEPFTVSIAPLAFALVTVLLGVRAGRRIGETPHHSLGQAVAIAVFAALAAAATVTAGDPAAQPSVWQGALLPPLVFALGVLIGSEGSRRRSRLEDEQSAAGGILGRLGQAAPRFSRAMGIGLTGGAAAVGIVVAVCAVTVAVLLAVSYGRIIGLYEGVQSGVLGGAALTIAQLGLLPNLVLWTASWFVGPGFAIGAGSSVSPLGTVLGPIPALPVLGALPEGDSAWGFLGLLVPVLAGFAAGAVLAPRLGRAGLSSPKEVVGTGIAIGLVGGALLGALAWAAAGAAGPGRLVEVGPSWLPVACWATLEIGVPATVALFVGRNRSMKPAPAERVVEPVPA